jgi:integrase
MFNPSYLTMSRHGVYYLRFPIPVRYHPERLQRSIRFSLKTREPREALHLGRALCYAAGQILRQGEARGMEYHAIREVVMLHFAELRDRRLQKIRENGLLTHEQRRSLGDMASWAEDALEWGDYLVAGRDADVRRLIDRYELPIQRESPSFEVLRGEMLKATIGFVDAVLQGNDAMNGYDLTLVSTPVLQSSRVAGKRQRRLVDAVEDYIADKLRLKQWREHSAVDYRKEFALLCQYLGEDATITILPEQAIAVKAMLVRMPKHSNKKPELRGLSIHELIALEGHERLSPVTVNKHLNAYSGLYGWLLKRKEVDENPFNGLIDNTSKVAVERVSYSPEQITRILAAVEQTPKPHHRWGALIAFYTGARVNEIAQLAVADIVEQGGVLCFSFTTEDEEGRKRLKNDASKRMIPVHSRLQELGFREYVASLPASGRLFPELSFHPKQGYGRNISRWFNESLLPAKLKIKSPSLVFHSIRHTVASTLRNAQVAEATIKDILGHSHDDVTNAVYAKNLDKKVMLQAIEKLVY